MESRINPRGEQAKTEALPRVMTIGHSTRTLEEFVRLPQPHAVTRVVDVRTVPRSGDNPVASKRSCSLAVVELEQPTHTFASADLAGALTDSISRFGK